MTISIRNITLAAVTAMAMISCAQAPESSVSAEENGNSDEIIYHESVSKWFDLDKCSQPAADAVALAALDGIIEAGADWPDQLYISSLVRISSKIYQGTVESYYGAWIEVDSNCDIVKLTPMVTVRAPKLFSKKSALGKLATLGQQTLGQEIFGDSNIGGAYEMTLNALNEEFMSEEAMISRFYSEWFGLETAAKLVTDQSEESITALLKDLQIKEFEERPRTKELLVGFKTELKAALTDADRYKLYKGRWLDYGVIGDPAANYLVVFDTYRGDALILEQGFVD